jgi:serine/threonine protein kinase
MKTYLGSEAEHYCNAEATKHRTLGYNPGIIEFYGSFTRRESYNIILEYTDKGSLADYFRKEPPPTHREEVIKFWESMFKLLSALRHIHALGSGDPNEPQASQGYVDLVTYMLPQNHLF